MFRLSRDVAQSGRAPRSGRGGRWFKSSRPDHPLIIAFNKVDPHRFAIRCSPVEPDVKNVQKSDRRLLLYFLKSSTREVAAFSDGRQYIRSRSLFWRRAHRCSYIFQGSFPDCIPWFFSPSYASSNAAGTSNNPYDEIDRWRFLKKLYKLLLYFGKMVPSIFP